MGKDSRGPLPTGPSWQTVFLAITLATLTSTGWIIRELSRGVGYGKSLTRSAKRDSSMADSLANGLALVRSVVEKADSARVQSEKNNQAIRAGVETISNKLDALSNSNRQFQQRRFAELSAKADTVKATVAKIDSVTTTTRKKGR